MVKVDGANGFEIINTQQLASSVYSAQVVYHSLLKTSHLQWLAAHDIRTQFNLIYCF